MQIRLIAHEHAHRVVLPSVRPLRNTAKVNGRLLLVLATSLNLLWGLLNTFMDAVFDNDRFVYLGKHDTIPSGIQTLLLLASLFAATKFSFTTLTGGSTRIAAMAIACLIVHGAGVILLTRDHRAGPGLAAICAVAIAAQSNWFTYGRRVPLSGHLSHVSKQLRRQP